MPVPGRLSSIHLLVDLLDALFNLVHAAGVHAGRDFGGKLYLRSLLGHVRNH
eukprot:CAMPEP_0177225498 /NCGR_PEP_ID=MMETSP0367-20130122/39576_1 /TAXON_ID=447022 ORGANISM="Scrippsiella hangoei-like, Strain SHHI-4" /NCGR_SAMPLE_ID=MMETSP0367 /ASSEMBLY_ACC=CAM_ASM_000362 /LENGTH=51 /DNA_ID=CAMNT_0018675591 /DNA_START=17 /DNA_END=169 /DNA_ORIENTATION=-